MQMEEEKLDDFLAFFPNFRYIANEVENKISDFSIQCEQLWRNCRKQLAETVGKDPLRGYIFYRLDHPGCTPEDYLLKVATDRAAKRYLKL